MRIEKEGIYCAILFKRTVTVVLEHNTDSTDCKVHGVFACRDEAEVLRDSLDVKGYISVLDFKLKDEDNKFTMDVIFNTDDINGTFEGTLRCRE